MSEQSSEPLVEVHIRGIPTDILQRSREHNDGLMREFALIRLRSPDAQDVPHRLHQLADDLTLRFGSFTAATEAEMAEAEARGDRTVDLVYRVPATVSAAAVEFGALLDEADGYCRSGEHLLTLVTPPDALALRHWFFAELVGQIAGKEPTSWPEWSARIAED